MTKIACDNPEMQHLFGEAGTTAERMEDGRVGVANWPKVRRSNPTFLSDELASFLATQPKAESHPITETSDGQKTHQD